MKKRCFSNIIKSILLLGIICLCFEPSKAYAQVGESVSIDDGDFNPLTDDITKKIPSLEVLIDSAIYNSHRLRYWDKEISITNYELKTSKRDWANYVSVAADFKEGSWASLTFVEDQYGNEVGTLGSTNQSKWGLGISLRLPIISMIDYKNQVNISKMKIESKMEQRLQDKKAIRAEVINLYNELVIQQKMLRLDIDNIEYSTLTTEMADKEYQNNNISLADMSRVRDNLARARYRYVRTKINFINAYVMLQEVTGVKFADLNNWE